MTAIRTLAPPPPRRDGERLHWALVTERGVARPVNRATVARVA
ncbi:MAG TPA: hypothetical protein VES79_05150 [Solirubrobacteraceae bacterium]|nr:hypothetical protein [Solirubrobacteraceae bacterium]